MGLALLVAGFFWSWAIVFSIFIVLNLKTLYKALLGKLPLEVSQEAFSGPYRHTYSREGRRDLNLDIYYPTGYDKGEAGFPLVFFAHGGGWISDSR